MEFPELPYKLDHNLHQGLLGFPLSAYLLGIGVHVHWYGSVSPNNIHPHNHRMHPSPKHFVTTPNPVGLEELVLKFWSLTGRVSPKPGRNLGLSLTIYIPSYNEEKHNRWTHSSTATRPISQSDESHARSTQSSIHKRIVHKLQV